MSVECILHGVAKWRLTTSSRHGKRYRKWASWRNNIYWSYCLSLSQTLWLHHLYRALQTLNQLSLYAIEPLINMKNLLIESLFHLLHIIHDAWRNSISLSVIAGLFLNALRHFRMEVDRTILIDVPRGSLVDATVLLLHCVQVTSVTSTVLNERARDCVPVGVAPRRDYLAPTNFHSELASWV